MKKNIQAILLLFLISISYGKWTHNFYVDEFGDNTKDDFISSVDTHGHFSNSATANSKLYAEILIYYSKGYRAQDSIPDVRFDLHEYGEEKTVGKVIGKGTYELAIKLSDNSIERYDLHATNNALLINHDSHEKRIKFLNNIKRESKPIKCIITTGNKYAGSTYNFSINPMGFTKTFAKLKPK